VWVPEAGHNSNADAPAFVNAQIEAFVERCGLQLVD
jgi:pimeloyl-ACP methyl ester carboxylesterase